MALNPACSFVIRSECLFREGCLRKPAHSPGYSTRTLDLGRVLPEARLTGSRQSPTARYYVSCGDKRMSGSAMGRGRSQENLRNVWWRVRSGPERILFFPVHRQQEPIQSFRASTNVVLCWFQRGRCFCMIPCTADSTRVPSTYTEESISIWR